MGQTVAWALAAILGLAIVLRVVLPRLIGAESFTVESGSMEPAIPTGSIVVAQPTAAEDGRFDDVITYQLESGKPQTVTHRVVGVNVSDGQIGANRQAQTAARFNGWLWNGGEDCAQR